MMAHGGALMTPLHGGGGGGGSGGRAVGNTPLSGGGEAAGALAVHKPKQVCQHLGCGKQFSWQQAGAYTRPLFGST
jgi:hypothetical protein